MKTRTKIGFTLSIIILAIALALITQISDSGGGPLDSRSGKDARLFFSIILLGCFGLSVLDFQRAIRKDKVAKAIGTDLTEIPENKVFKVIMQNPEPKGLFLRLVFEDAKDSLANFSIKETFLSETVNGLEEIKRLPEGKELSVRKRQKHEIIKKEDYYEEAVAETVYYVIGHSGEGKS